jgi:hypothetical protein
MKQTPPYMKLTLAAVVLCLGASLSEAAVFLDFSNTPNSSDAPIMSSFLDGSTVWNDAQINNSSTAGPIFFNNVALLDSTGAASGILFSFNAGATSNGLFSQSAGGATGVSGYPDVTSADFWLTNSGAIVKTFTFSGLSASTAYNFELLSARAVVNGDQRSVFTFNGLTAGQAIVTRDATFNTTADFINGITSDAGGVITVTWNSPAAPTGTPRNFINFMKITAVPEPSTVALASIGSLLLLVQVVRRKTTTLS